MTPSRPNNSSSSNRGPSRPAGNGGTGGGQRSSTGNTGSGGYRSGGTGGPQRQAGSGSGGTPRTGGTGGPPRPAGSGGPQRTGGTGGPQRTGGGGPPRPGQPQGQSPGGPNTGGPPRPSGGGGRFGGNRSGSRGRGRPSKKRIDQDADGRGRHGDTAIKEDSIEIEGVVSAVLAGTQFHVKLDNEHQVLAHISGKMRKRFIRLVVGDRVKMEMSPYDTTKARIVFRL